MAKVKVYIKCKCGFNNGVVISRPTSTSKASGITACGKCLSQLGYAVVAGERYGQVNVESIVLNISNDLHKKFIEDSLPDNQHLIPVD